MPYQKKEFDFTLFVNEGAVGNRPAFSGTIYVNGQEVPIAGWKRTTKSGKPVIAGCKSIKRDNTPAEKKKSNDGWATHSADDDIPF